ncbi:hypothetical protein NPIL_498481 [Nephila pilipes]|uniref:Uncharacterized protein n=1 Tax=Nephila pilipes TaxID=299642 RepID=A0A8X6MBW0_NEPPI|nr:hypothetical protein NPIL_498481 [Nephila pilipes]
MFYDRRRQKALYQPGDKVQMKSLGLTIAQPHEPINCQFQETVELQHFSGEGAGLGNKADCSPRRRTNQRGRL